MKSISCEDAGLQTLKNTPNRCIAKITVITKKPPGLSLSDYLILNFIQIYISYLIRLNTQIV